MQLCGRAAADVLSGPDSCRHARESAQGIDRLSCFLHSTVPLSSFQVWMHVVPWGPVGAGGRGGGGGGVCVCVCVCVYTRMCACMCARLSMRVHLCGLEHTEMTQSRTCAPTSFSTTFLSLARNIATICVIVKTFGSPLTITCLHHTTDLRVQ